VPPDLTLLVLRTSDVPSTRRLYEGFGLRFTDERHGSGPRHCSATLDSGLVIEIYPAKTSIIENSRLGFVVTDLPAVLHAVTAAGAKVIGYESGGVVVVEDLDGRRVELHPSSDSIVG